MATDLFLKLSEYFVRKQYKMIKTDSESVRMFATYNKNSLYLINVISKDGTHFLDSEKYSRYREITRRQFKRAPVDKIVLLNIALVDNPNQYYDKLNTPSELDDYFIDVNWMINLTNSELVIPSRQIKSILTLKQDLQNILEQRPVSYVKLNKVKKYPMITESIIFLNILLYLSLVLSPGAFEDKLVSYGALYYTNVLSYNEYWRLLTAVFLHGGLSHLVFNCFNLYIFGSRIEKYLSNTQFLLIYLISGIIGSASSVIMSLILKGPVMSLGASGAIYGLIGCIIVCSKRSGKVIEGLNSYILIVYVIVGMIVSVISTSIDSAAHLGGFLGGIVMTLIIVRKDKDYLTSE